METRPSASDVAGRDAQTPSGKPLCRFARLAVASKLVTPEQVSACLNTVPARLHMEDEPVARAIVRAGLLTRWQAEKIWAGRTAGFFIGQYKILDMLGEGGMGKVYRAEHTFMNRKVAIKLLPPKRMENSQAVARFLREVRAFGQLEHPNIVTVHDAGQQDKIVYMVMELVDGLNLAQYVALEGPMPPAMAADVIAQAAAGLEYASERGIVHRDIKPQNLMLSNSGQVKILDMGVVRMADGEMRPIGGVGPSPQDAMLTADGTVCGTLSYIAPEQARDSHAADVRSDLYSLGCSFYFLLSGQHAFLGKTPAELLRQKMTGDRRPLRDVAPGVPEELIDIVERMMAHHPKDRPQTPREARDLLAPWRQQYLAPTNSPSRELNDDALAWLKKSEAAEESVDDLAWLVASDADDRRPTRPSGVGRIPTVEVMTSETPFPGGRSQAPHDSRVSESSRYVEERGLLARVIQLPLAVRLGLVACAGLIVVAIGLLAWGGSGAASDEEKIAKVAPRAVETAQPRLTVNGIGMKLALLEPGTFWMGSSEDDKDADESERPRHKVTISRPFYMGVKEVTQIEYDAVMEQKPSTFVGSDLPVETISYEDAVEFCRRLSAEEGETYRLPTEAEWEYACRAGTQTRWSFGDREHDLKRYGWRQRLGGAPLEKTQPAGALSSNRWGLFDMHGNVAEWCSDWYGPYDDKAQTDPPGPQTGKQRVARGGNCFMEASDCRSARRLAVDGPDSGVGFRVVREISKPKPAAKETTEAVDAPENASREAE